jgi:hypothetical protein
MRWINVIVALSLTAAPIFAGTEGTGKFGFNPTRMQVAQAMSQPQEETSSQPEMDVNAEPRLVPGKATLLSAILPGAGQYYAKSPFWAAGFLALEIGAWAGVALYHSEGMDKEDQYIAYAEDHWIYGGPDYGNEYDSYFGYEYWAASTYGNYPDTQDEWYDLTWSEKQQYLPSDGFTHELDPNDKDQQYYEMIGKYGQFAPGWDDYTEENYPFNEWRTNSKITPHRDYYLNLRKQSNDALDMSKNFTMVVLANHLISALHAGFTVSVHNRKLAKEQTIEGAFHLEPKKYKDEIVTMGGLTIRF